MSAPLHGPRPSARLGVALLISLVLAALLSVAPAPAQARDEEGAIDAPVMPAGCFGPGRSGIDPFPCPLNTNRENRPTVILWGDSHAYMYIPALREAVRGKPVNLISFVAGSCPPVLVTKAFGSGKCERSNYVALETVKKLIAQKADFKVVLGSNWTGFRTAYRKIFLEEVGVPSGYDDFTKKMVRLAHEGTPRLFDTLGRLGVDVDVISQAAVVPERRQPCAAGEEPYACDLPRWRALPENWKTKQYLREQLAKVRGRKSLIDATPGYCDELVCRGQVGEVKTYFDDLHLSATRTRFLAKYFKPAVNAVL